MRGFFCAQDWNRTSTSLRMADFESAASTNSATWAINFGMQYYVKYNCAPKSCAFFSKLFRTSVSDGCFILRKIFAQ